jgi:hypothetical protein
MHNISLNADRLPSSIVGFLHGTFRAAKSLVDGLSQSASCQNISAKVCNHDLIIHNAVRPDPSDLGSFRYVPPHAVKSTINDHASGLMKSSSRRIPVVIEIKSGEMQTHAP